MGVVWKPDLVLRNCLYDALDEADQRDLDFSRIATTSFKDPIFNNVWHRVWIDHVLYSRFGDQHWVTGANVHSHMQDGEPIWRKHPHASDHFPVSVEIDV